MLSHIFLLSKTFDIHTSPIYFLSQRATLCFVILNSVLQRHINSFQPVKSPDPFSNPKSKRIKSDFERTHTMYIMRFSKCCPLHSSFIYKIVPKSLLCFPQVTTQLPTSTLHRHYHSKHKIS